MIMDLGGRITVRVESIDAIRIISGFGIELTIGGQKIDYKCKSESHSVNLYKSIVTEMDNDLVIMVGGDL